MESNFIRERSVVREQIIKKNLERDNEERKKAGINQPSAASTSSASTDYSIENPPGRVVVLEELVNENLKQDLVNISREVDKVCEIIADYLKVKAALKIFKFNPRDVRVQTNIGCNFYAQCHIEDASKVYVCVGSDYYLLMELDEALKMIDFKEKQWTRQLDLLQEKASKTKAHIKIALEALSRVYEVDRDKLSCS